jgi:hypothetical protein
VDLDFKLKASSLFSRRIGALALSEARMPQQITPAVMVAEGRAK